jgi:hypothetical protein
MLYSPYYSVDLSPHYKQGHIISWQIDPVFSDSFPHNFTVQVAGTPDFSELLYELPAGNSFFVVDNSHIKQSFTKDVYYRVKLETGDNNTYISKTVAFTGERYDSRNYFKAREIVRKELLRMTKYTGHQAWLLKRKTYGAVDTSNPLLDPVSGVPLTDQTTSPGTQFNVGYYDPLAFWISYENGKAIRRQSSEGIGFTDVRQFELRTVGFPSVETYDVIVEPINDERYYVKDKQEVLFPGTDLIVVQTLQVQLIPPSDPVYEIEVPAVHHE